MFNFSYIFQTVTNILSKMVCKSVKKGKDWNWLEYNFSIITDLYYFVYYYCSIFIRRYTTVYLQFITVNFTIQNGSYDARIIPRSNNYFCSVYSL